MSPHTLSLVIVLAVATVAITIFAETARTRKEHYTTTTTYDSSSSRDLQRQVCVVDSSRKKADACLGAEDIRAIDDITAFASLMPGTFNGATKAQVVPASTRMCFGDYCLSTDKNNSASGPMAVTSSDNSATLAVFSAHRDRLRLPSLTTATNKNGTTTTTYHYWNDSGTANIYVPPTAP